jgi:bacterioferritin (cytochrome b1)
MQGDKKIIEALNKVLKNQLTAIIFYMRACLKTGAWKSLTTINTSNLYAS